ncbi:MAG: hypothetical protein SGI77_10855 [Pirellulaceae bacterium]|nr:hypothetical protein [Pirellulaceae bacterium]
MPILSINTALTAFLTLAFLALSLSAASPWTAVAITPDAKHVVVGSQQGIELYMWPEMIVAEKIESDLLHVHDLRFSPDGKTLLAAGGSPAEEGAVEIFAWLKRNRIRKLTLHNDVVYRVAWSPDGSRWAVASGDGICSVINAKSFEQVARYEGHSRAVLALDFLPDGKTIASVSVDQTVRLWDSVLGEHIRTLDNHVGTVNSIAVRPSKSNPNIAPTPSDSSLSMIATISEDRTLRIWQPSIGRLMRFIKLPSIPRAFAWSATGDRLYVGCNDGYLRVVDFESMKLLDEFEGIDGRVHDLIVDENRKQALVVGQAGFKIIDTNPSLADRKP